MTLTKNRGIIEVDDQGKIIDVCRHFCESFSMKKNELLGESINKIIQGTFSSNHKKIIFGKICGFRCLISVTKRNQYTVYRVIVREDDVDRDEIVAFLHSLDSREMKKKKPQQNKYRFTQIIGESPAINLVKDIAAKIATSDSTVLLSGESGTGKEVFAQAIHGLSSRKNNPFVAVNCAAIPEELFESEFFGYEAGAFSGAKKEGKPGKFELAQHGTLFLDEISELPYQLQGKLLRVLQEREVERVGGTESKNVDIRIIVATNRDLSTLVDEGKFRQDLFYRLFVFNITIPSLRERKEDILLLARHFIDVFNHRFDRHVKFIDTNLQEWLVNYDWPGNVRELKAYIERGMNIVEGDTLTLDHLFFSRRVSTTHPAASSGHPLLSLEEAIRNAEIAAIKSALKKANGDRTLAAQKLKIHFTSLYRKMAKYNLK
ncbi:sigma-54 interaction domain-containing protein [Bacillus benzoevorans]|uniref:Transcriptional regulator with PAS, ATPase and Fis domain n=1 Tax=Bacillus benzoevorans TaxID=1456 RepID=A0A7X0LX51_9BACI|nr:sigma 54-interacting transcriptional regulator [Bacillus benzoevorans]MBB6447806.1 transcriptional regulator with PAS, ATPase and Fis domain [Bacillus benzoevorans]